MSKHIIWCHNNNACVYNRCIFEHEPEEGDDTKCLCGIKCSRLICRFDHPVEHKKATRTRVSLKDRPECRHKNKCGHWNCAFRHTAPDDTALCRWGLECDRQICHYVHEEYVEKKEPDAVDKMCPRGAKCDFHRNGWCVYNHPKGTRPGLFEKFAIV